MSIDIMNITGNKPKATMEDYVWTVYGAPKAGKTSLFYELTKKNFGGDLSKSLLVAFEKGYKALNGIHAQDIGEWGDFQELVEQLVDNYDDIPYRWIGIDTLDVLYQKCSEYIVRKERIARKDAKIKSVGDIPWGQGFSLVDDEITKQLSTLINVGLGVFMISHDTDKQFTSRNGNQYDKTTVSLPKRARNTFLNMSDFILYISVEKEQDDKKKLVDNRYIYFRSDSDVEAGSRFNNVPEKINYDTDKFMEVFENAVLDSYNEDEEAVEEAKEEQTKEREEQSKEFVEEKKSESTNAEMIEKISDAIKDMDKEAQTGLKKTLKAEFGSYNYKKFNSEQLTQAINILEL